MRNFVKYTKNYVQMYEKFGGLYFMDFFPLNNPIFKLLEFSIRQQYSKADLDKPTEHIY
jgi:hypothetical protein